MFNEIRQVIEATASQPDLHVRRKDLDDAYKLVKTISSDTLENTMCEVSTYIPGGDRPNVPAFSKEYTKEKVTNLGAMLKDTMDNYPKSETIASATELYMNSSTWALGSLTDESAQTLAQLADSLRKCLNRGVATGCIAAVMKQLTIICDSRPDYRHKVITNFFLLGTIVKIMDHHKKCPIISWRGAQLLAVLSRCPPDFSPLSHRAEGAPFMEALSDLCKIVIKRYEDYDHIGFSLAVRALSQLCSDRQMARLCAQKTDWLKYASHSF